jgi:hypothetical protein
LLVKGNPVLSVHLRVPARPSGFKKAVRSPLNINVTREGYTNIKWLVQDPFGTKASVEVPPTSKTVRSPLDINDTREGYTNIKWLVQGQFNVKVTRQVPVDY